MKRTLLATILGLAVSVASTYGSEYLYFYFDTYMAVGSSAPAAAGQVMWTANALRAPAGEAGKPVTAADGIKADLLWQIGADSGDEGLAVPTSMGANGLDGYIQYISPLLVGPDYQPGTPIIFTIEVWQGGSYATATAQGSETWTAPYEEWWGYPPTWLTNLPEVSIIVSLVPEPTTLTLAGLGAAGMFMFRRRQ